MNGLYDDIKAKLDAMSDEEFMRICWDAGFCFTPLRYKWAATRFGAELAELGDDVLEEMSKTIKENF